MFLWCLVCLKRMKQIHFVLDEDWNDIVSERNAIAGGTRPQMGEKSKPRNILRRYQQWQWQQGNKVWRALGRIRRQGSWCTEHAEEEGTAVIWEAYALLVLQNHYHPFIFCFAETWNKQYIWGFSSVKSQPIQKVQHAMVYIWFEPKLILHFIQGLLHFSHFGNALLHFKFLSKWHSLASMLGPRMPLGPEKTKIKEDGSSICKWAI